MNGVSHIRNLFPGTACSLCVRLWKFCGKYVSPMTRATGLQTQIFEVFYTEFMMMYLAIVWRESSKSSRGVEMAMYKFDIPIKLKPKMLCILSETYQKAPKTLTPTLSRNFMKF